MIETKLIQSRLGEAIKQSGLTQSELAKQLNITQSAIAHFIRGDALPALDTFANLCKLLDVDTNYILCQE